jgi:hypothetical protein
MMMVMLWNFPRALEGFLINSRYCREDIGALVKQAQILSQFADYITKVHRLHICQLVCAVYCCLPRQV